MNLSQLCDLINLPCKEKVLSISNELGNVTYFFDELKDSSNWNDSLDEMKKKLGDDSDGMKVLTVMLICALESYKEYEKMGISKEIFKDTMKFCTRFINEHYKVYGVYAFTWAWWFPRQLSLREFRIDALEYEMIYENGEKLINIHIPEDADLSTDSVIKSYKKARTFFDKYFKEYSTAPMVCFSWLLSPVLEDMLPEYSNIMNFRKMFNIVKTDEKSNDGIRWIYRREDIPAKDLPESTSLQKKMKAHLLSGNFTGNGYGILSDEYIKELINIQNI